MEEYYAFVKFTKSFVNLTKSSILQLLESGYFLRKF